jgi:putative transposase
LQSTEVRSQAHAYLTGTLRALDCIPLEVGGVADHVHILCGLSRKENLGRIN